MNRLIFEILSGLIMTLMIHNQLISKAVVALQD